MKNAGEAGYTPTCSTNSVNVLLPSLVLPRIAPSEFLESFLPTGGGTGKERLSGELASAVAGIKGIPSIEGASSVGIVKEEGRV